MYLSAVLLLRYHISDINIFYTTFTDATVFLSSLAMHSTFDHCDAVSSTILTFKEYGILKYVLHALNTLNAFFALFHFSLFFTYTLSMHFMSSSFS